MTPRAVHDDLSPEIDGSRCVYSVLTNASCSSCVQACPRQAIVLTDESLGIDESACNACGICVAACPVAAIDMARGEIALTPSGQHQTAFVGCGQCEPESKVPKVSCVHVLGLRDLAGLYQRGVRRLIAHRSCMNCHQPDGGDLSARSDVRLDASADTETNLDTNPGSGPVLGQSLGATVEQFNRLAESRQLAKVQLDVTTVERWNELAGRAVGGDLPGDRSRRALFTRLLSDVAALDTNVFDLDADPTHDVPPVNDSVVADSTAAESDVLFPVVPHIDAKKCNGCDACSRLCPSGALELIQDDPSGLYYHLAADKCTGCNLCVDVCDRKATSLAFMQTQDYHQIALTSTTCRLCGADYHLPEASDMQDEQLCQICREHNHMANLYQVLS